MITRRFLTTLALARLIPIYFAFRIIKRVVSIDTAARWAWRRPRAPRDVERERRLVARVVRLTTLLRASEGDCMHRGLLLYRELSRMGADPILVVGFRRDLHVVRGHAWVVVDGEPVAESAVAVRAFTKTMAFAREGVRALQD